MSANKKKSATSFFFAKLFDITTANSNTKCNETQSACKQIRFVMLAICETTVQWSIGATLWH